MNLTSNIHVSTLEKSHARVEPSQVNGAQASHITYAPNLGLLDPSIKTAMHIEQIGPNHFRSIDELQPPDIEKIGLGQESDLMQNSMEKVAETR